jgi:hypothetical protein
MDTAGCSIIDSLAAWLWLADALLLSPDEHALTMSASTVAPRASVRYFRIGSSLCPVG